MAVYGQKSRITIFFFLRNCGKKQKGNAPAGNQTRVSSVAGTYTITVLPAQGLSIPRLELGTSRVLGERHDQLDHTDAVSGVSGFRSQYLVVANDARFRLRQYPYTFCATPVGFEPTRAKPTHLAGEPLNHSGKVSSTKRDSFAEERERNTVG